MTNLGMKANNVLTLPTLGNAMSRNINRVLQVLAALPHILRRRRARGGLSREQFKDTCLVFQIGSLVHCFMCASVWWARGHHDPMNWMGVCLAAAWTVFFWSFLLKQAYAQLKRAVESEIKR